MSRPLCFLRQVAIFVMFRILCMDLSLNSSISLLDDLFVVYCSVIEKCLLAHVVVFNRVTAIVPREGIDQRNLRAITRILNHLIDDVDYFPDGIVYHR
jgi:hypothetical protein